MKESRLVRRAHANALLVARIERIKKKDARIVHATQFAAHVERKLNPETGDLEAVIPDVVDGHRLLPWEKRVALDARNGKRDAPVYLELAAKRFEVERKIEALRGAPTQLNVQMIAVVQGDVEQTNRYPVIDVEARDVSSRELPALPEPVRKEKDDGT